MSGSVVRKTIAVIAPVSSLMRRVRLRKLTNVLLDNSFDVEFWGWEREKNEADRSEHIDGRISQHFLLRGGGRASRLTRSLYPIWMFLVFVTILGIGRRRTILALGWETAFPALLAAKITKSEVIFDDADRTSLVLDLPKPLENLLGRLEKWASIHSAIHIIPGTSRYSWQHDNMFVLKNTPATGDLITNASVINETYRGLTVLINGLMDWDTGARVFAKTIELLEGLAAEIRFFVAGKPVCDEAKELIKRKSVTFFGYLPQTQMFDLYRQADIVLTYYDPAVKINLYAESNKWGDCIWLDVPFVVNEEVKTAKEFVDCGAAFACPYEDHHCLAELLMAFASDRRPLELARKALVSFKPAFLPYQVQAEKLIAKITLVDSLLDCPTGVRKKLHDAPPAV